MAVPPLLCVALAMATACSGLSDRRSTLADLQSLQQGLARELGEANINVNHSTNGALTVTLVNSRLADLPEAERARQARAIGEFVRDHYARYDSLQYVAIGFKSQAGVGGFSVGKTSVPYAFSVQDLGQPAPGAVPDTSAGSERDSSAVARGQPGT